MAKFAVLEPEASLARRLVARFGPAAAVEQEPWLLVIAPGACGQCGRQPIRCHTVLLPGGEGGLPEGVRARGAVSYGLSGRDTITLSSREGQRMWVAVQRELVRLDGSVLERQELPVHIPEGSDELQGLALVGAMLLLGASAEEL